MKSILRRLKASKFVRDTLFLQSATGLELAASLLTLFAMTHLLTQEDYGTWAQVLKVQDLLTVFLSVGIVQATLGRLPTAVAAGNRERVRELLAFFLKASVLLNGFAAMAAALAAPLVARYCFGIDDFWVVGGLAAALLLSLPAGIPSRLVSTALQGSRRMEELSRYESLASLQRTAFSLLSLGVVVLAGSSGAAAVACVVGGSVLGSCANSTTALFMYRSWRRSYAARDRVDVDLPALREIFSRALRVPLRQDLPFSMWIGLDKNVANLVVLIPFMILGHAVDPETKKHATGLFHFALRLLSFPLQALNAVARNALVKLSERRGAKDWDGFFRVYRQVTLACGAYSVALIVPFALLAPWVVPALFPPKYAEAVPYLHILAIYAAVQGFGSALGSVFNVFERIGASLLIKVVAVAAVLPFGIHWSRTFADPTTAVSLYHTVQLLVISAIAFVYVGYLRAHRERAADF